MALRIQQSLSCRLFLRYISCDSALWCRLVQECWGSLVLLWRGVSMRTVQLRDQDLLALEAALFPGSALSAWMHFKDRYEVDDLYPPSIELLPLIQHTLTNRCNVHDEPLFRKVAGVQRKNW